MTRSHSNQYYFKKNSFFCDFDRYKIILALRNKYKRGNKKNNKDLLAPPPVIPYR